MKQIEVAIFQKINETSVQHVFDEQVEKTAIVLLEGEHTDAYNIFVRPFTKVFKAARLVGMDIGNSLGLILKSVFSWKPEQLKKALATYDSKRQRINAEWKPILDEAEKILGGVDPLLKMAILGPKYYFLMKGAKFGIDRGKNVAEFFTGTAWETLVNKNTTPFDTNQNLRDLINQQEKQNKEQNKLLQKLTKLFVGDQVASGGGIKESMVFEATQDPSSKDASFVEDLIAATGIEEECQKLKVDLATNRINTGKEILRQLKTSKPAFAIFAAKDLTSLEKATKEAQQAGMQVDTSALQDIKKKTEEAAKSLLKADSEKASKSKTKQASQKTGTEAAGKPTEIKEADTAAVTDKNQPAVSTEESLKKAELAVFNAGKEKMNLEMLPQLRSMLDDFKEAIEKLKVDSETESAMEKSQDPVVQLDLKVYKTLMDEYKKFQEAYNSQVKS